MSARGPQTICRLQKPTETRTDPGGGSDTWEDLVEFSGVLVDLTETEALLFAKDTVVSTHRLTVSAADIKLDNIAEVKEKNSISVLNTESNLEPQMFDITGVKPIKRGRGRLTFFQIMLREVI